MKFDEWKVIIISFRLWAKLAPGQYGLTHWRGEKWKGLLAIAKLKPLSLFISPLLMPKKAFYNVKIEKWKVKVVSA